MQKIMFNSKFGLEQAVLEGRKTMTRRAISPKVWDKYCEYERGYQQARQSLIGGLMDCDEYLISLAIFKVGEVVAIAQAYKDTPASKDFFKDAAFLKKYKETKGWGNKMFVKADLMPHHIEITDIKVERLQNISDEDCLREGICKTSDACRPYYIPNTGRPTFANPREAFAALIDKMSGKGTWESNPYCFCYTFELID